MSKLVIGLKWAWAIITSPWRLFQSVRRSMTGASVIILLIGIITLNIVWGYPWTGMFSASVSMLTIGWIVNRLMRPRLRVGFSLPTSTPAGETFTIVTHVENRSRLPAMDLRFQFGNDGIRGLPLPAAEGGFETLSPAHGCPVIHPGEHVDLSTIVEYEQRGIHKIPDLVTVSTFPFHLFRSARRISSDAVMAITPRPITGEEDAFTREMLSALGGWSHRLLAGDALDYTGSREYQDGMPVRRWDFASWARLGRPIVREFQSPSIQAVTLILDTGDPEVRDHAFNKEQRFEHLLSLAATAINELIRKLVLVRLYVSNEDSAVITGVDMGGSTGGDRESLLIRLASADFTRAEPSDRRLEKVLDHVSKLPVVVLTLRPDADVWQSLPNTVTVLRADDAHEAMPSTPRVAGAKRSRSDEVGV